MTVTLPPGSGRRATPLRDVLASAAGVEYFEGLGYTVRVSGDMAQFTAHNWPYQMYQEYGFKWVLAADIQVWNDQGLAPDTQVLVSRRATNRVRHVR
jgi:hypothetical protein